MPIRRERLVILALLGLSGAACLLGAAAPPSSGPQDTPVEELLAISRVLCTAALAVTLMLGPGVAWRALGGRPLGLGFLAVPGLAILAGVGGLAWALAGSVSAETVAFACCAPLLGLLFGVLVACGPDDLFDTEEQRTLLIVSLALALAVAKSLWSIGPEGEWFAGGISRTLNPEGRPDSRISYHVVQLIANGAHPYGPAANALFAPYNFSSRGPWPGMGTAPIVFLSGGHPPLAAPELPWRPFDAQGFMAYRIATIAFSCTVFLALWDLVRRLGGVPAARFALLLAAGTPFIFAELWFTWPKLLAVTFVLLAAILLFERRSFRSGLMVGIGFLAHPSALGGLFALGPLSVWPAHGASWRRPRVLAPILLAAGTGVAVLFWREINGPHLLQDQFFGYLTAAGGDSNPSLSLWIHFRAHTALNTLVPLYLPLFDAHNHSINEFRGISPEVVHFFFQYWTSVPFAFGIVFLPMMLLSLWRALRRWTWATTAVVLIPFAIFAAYWGQNSSGLLREGMQFWVLGVIALIALQQASAGFPWLRSRPARAVLVLRVGEVFALAVGATLATHGFDPLSAGYRLSDACALLLLLGASLAIARLVWSEAAATARAPDSRRG